MSAILRAESKWGWTWGAPQKLEKENGFSYQTNALKWSGTQSGTELQDLVQYIYVSVCYGCCNETPQLGDLKQQTCIASQYGKAEVWSQDDSRAMLSLKCRGASILGSS